MPLVFTEVGASAPAVSSSMLRLPAALVTAAATPGSALMPPSRPPNSAAHMSPRPRMSMIGYLPVSSSRPCSHTPKNESASERHLQPSPGQNFGGGRNGVA